MRPLVVFLVLLGGCADRVDLQTVSLRLRAPASGPCSPGAPTSDLVVEALGDFPASDERTIEVLGADGPGIIDRFPVGTRALTVRAHAGGWEGFALFPRIGDADAEARLLLLPASTSCLVPDPALVDGDTAVALPDGSLVLAGGDDGEVGSRRLVHWHPGEAAATVADPGLQLRREGSVAVAAGERVFVLGGALGREGPAHDTYEIYDAETRALRSGLGTLGEPRRDAGAARLSDGRILLVGGRAAGGGDPLASAEVLDDDTGASAPVGELPVGRADPSVVVLDDGSVLVVGGTSAAGGVLRPLLAFDPRSSTFVELGLDAPAGLQAVAPLPGGRLALLASSRPGELTLYRNAPPLLGPVPGLVEDTVAVALPAFETATAVALMDGTLLVSGATASGRQAFVVDPGTATVREVPPPRALGRLIALADGTTAALDAEGLALRRTTERSALDHPPASLLAEDLALDGPDRWRTEGAALVAQVDDARADLAGLRFADFALEVTAEGSVELLLQPEGAPATAVHVGASEAGPSLCTLEGAGPLTLVRRGDALGLARGGSQRTCRVDGLVGRVGLGFRARAGSRFERIAARRLEAE